MADHNETAILVTAKMIECRDTMRRFFGDKYAERTEPFRDAIRRWTKESGEPITRVAMTVIKLAQEKGSDIDGALAIAAAAEELISLERPGSADAPIDGRVANPKEGRE